VFKATRSGGRRYPVESSYGQDLRGKTPAR
jgi:hypothetical protein